jgi:RimJ/RimL family protein N-acetyltransferase
MTEDEVRLRPVVEDDLPVLDSLTGEPEAMGEFGWYGWYDLGRWRDGWDHNRLIGPDRGLLLIAAGDERLGFVNWRRRTTTPTAWHWEIGIALRAGARGRGYGTLAQRQLAGYLFAHSPVHRVEAITEAGNRAEQRALEKAGFTREGELRGIGWRAGAWRDGVIYSILRTDPSAPAGAA